MNSSVPIYALEPFYGGSHKQFLDGLQSELNVKVRILSMSPHHWKWRMHRSAGYFADMINGEKLEPGIILASDFVDLPALKGLINNPTHWTWLCYFHENQLTYPFRQRKERDLTYAHMNILSALAADRAYFNSEFHRQDFINAIPKFYSRFIDYTPGDYTERIHAKSSVLPLGIYLKKFDQFASEKPVSTPGIILWNQRWEHDKNPRLFFETLFALADQDIPYQLIVCGERFSDYPDIFDQARTRLDDRIIHWGYAEKFEEYARLLWQADIVVSTAEHEFFGISILEAMYCQCYPLLPNRLVYPEYIPEPSKKRNLYRGQKQLARKLTDALSDLKVTREVHFRHIAEQFDWENMKSRWNREISSWLEST